MKVKGGAKRRRCVVVHRCIEESGGEGNTYSRLGSGADGNAMESLLLATNVAKSSF